MRGSASHTGPRRRQHQRTYACMQSQDACHTLAAPAAVTHTVPRVDWTHVDEASQSWSFPRSTGILPCIISTLCSLLDQSQENVELNSDLLRPTRKPESSEDVAAAQPNPAIAYDFVEITCPQERSSPSQPISKLLRSHMALFCNPTSVIDSVRSFLWVIVPLLLLSWA